jgi:hypothetical protein
MFPGNIAAKNINDIANNIIDSNYKSGVSVSKGNGGIRKFFHRIVGLAK